MLRDGYPAIYDEWVDLVFDAREGRAKRAEWEARRERVNRIFKRGR